MSDVMTAAPPEELLEKYKGQMCSLISRAQGEDMIGFATGLNLRLLIEMPAPWGSSFRDMKPDGSRLGEIIVAAYHRGEKTYGGAILPDPTQSVAGMRRVLAWRRPQAPFAHFERVEYLVPADQVVPLVTVLVEQPDDLPTFEANLITDSPPRDIVVCTHGAIEASCAKFGYSVYKGLKETIEREAPGSARVWRGSHIGGCRMAATLFDMPHGRYWGHIDSEHIEPLALRRGPVAPLYGCYRGWSGLSYFEQVVEREVFMQTGWEWTDARVMGETLWRDGGGDRTESPIMTSNPPRAVGVRLDYRAPDGTSGAYLGTVEYVKTLDTVNSTKTPRWFTVNQYRCTHLEQA